MTKGKTRVMLDNGLVIITKKVDVHGAYTSLGINVGSIDEPAAKNGLAHLVEHMFFRTNRNMTGDQYQEALEWAGIDYNAMTSFTDTIFYADSQKNQVCDVINLFYDAISNNNFIEEGFETEKSAVISELRDFHRSSLDRFQERIMWPVIYKGTPLEKAIIGTVESVKNLSLEDVQKFTNTFYVPNNMVMACTGDIDTEVFIEGVKNTFGQLKSREFDKLKIDWKFKPGKKYVEFKDLKDEHCRELDLSFFYVIYPMSNLKKQDFATATVLETVLGGGNLTNFTGKIIGELRVKRGLCYSTDVEFEWDQGIPLAVIGVPGIHPQNLDEGINIVLNTLHELGSQELKNDYFKGKISQTKRRLKPNYYYIDNLVEEIIRREFSKNRLITDTSIKEIGNVSPKRLKYFAQKIFSQEPLIVAASAPGYKNQFNS